MFPRIPDLNAQLEHKRMSRDDIVNRAEKEGRPHTDEENKLFDELSAQMEQLELQITNIQETIARRDRADVDRKKSEEGRGRVTKADPPAVNAAVDTFRIPAVAKRTGKLKAFRGAHAEERAYRSGMWARATLFRSERAFDWCLRNGIDIRNAQSEGDNSAGGALVPEDFSQAIIDLREEYGVFRQNTYVEPMGSDTMLIPRRKGGATAYYVGEGTQVTESATSWDNIRLTAKKLASLVRFSTEVDEDAIISFADRLAMEIAYAFANAEDLAGFTGDGTSTYGGIRGITNYLTTANGYGGVGNAASGHDTMAEIDATDLQTCMSKLPQYARKGAKWFCSSVAFDLIFGRLMANAGGNTIRDVEAGYTPMYLGYPIVISQVLPTSTGTINGTPVLLFGNLNLTAAMGDRRGIRIRPSDQRYLEYDQLALLATQRFDIVNHDLDSSTAGPMAALCGTT